MSFTMPAAKYHTPVTAKTALPFVIKATELGPVVSIGPVVHPDFIPLLTGSGPINIFCVAVAIKAPSVVSRLASAISKVIACWPLGVLLAL